MNTEEQEFYALYAKFSAWKTSQSKQVDGYEYERSFVEFCKDLNKDLLLIATQPVQEMTKKKL
jgi:hypothetical protein